jgi:hypothetical protein
MTIEVHKAADKSVVKKAPRAVKKVKPPEAPKPPETKKPSDKYVVTKTGLGSYGGNVHSFKAGTVLTDYFVINQLLKANADFIEPLSEDTVIRTCPHCKEKLVIHAHDILPKSSS